MRLVAELRSFGKHQSCNYCNFMLQVTPTESVRHMASPRKGLKRRPLLGLHPGFSEPEGRHSRAPQHSVLAQFQMWLVRTRRFLWQGRLNCRSRVSQSKFGPISRVYALDVEHADNFLILPTFPQTSPEKTKFSRYRVSGSAVQPSARLPSSHSFHGEVSSCSLLLLSISLVQLCAAAYPKPRRARFRALRLRYAPEIDSPSLRSFPRQL
jgi:hypothetical protein